MHVSFDYFTDTLEYTKKETYGSINAKIDTTDSTLIKILKNVLYHDQHYREILVKLQISTVRNMDSIILVSDSIIHYDSLNLKIVEGIISKLKKWPRVDVVGEKGNQTIFMIIQHAATAVQKKYLHLFKKSIDAGDSPKYYYPYLIDRILTRTDKKQIFGTQVEYDTVKRKYVSLPIKNKHKVDKRREKYDLPALADYLKVLNNETH